MKTTKILLTALIVPLLFNACDHDDPTTEPPEEGKSVSQLIATIDQGNETTPKAGVVEDNDYTQGEKFYWNKGDATTVFFRNSEMTNATQYKRVDYVADVAAGVQSNSCTFNATGDESADNGAYTAYGLYPTSAWYLETKHAEFLTIDIPCTYQIQTQANSTHTGSYMLMKAQSDVVVDGSSPIHLTYKHLSSMLRFTVRNNSGNNSLKLANINVRLSSGKSVFATHAKLPDLDATSLDLPFTDIFNASALTLSLTGDARNFSTKDGKSQCEGYMAVLPTKTDAFDSADNLIFELTLTDGSNHYLATKTYSIGTDLNFLSNGIEQGKSYNFQLKVDNTDLKAMTGTSYAVGDYWPNSTNPEGIVFWVKPGSNGTKGKVMSLNETDVAKWGPENNEDAAGVAGIRSLTDGATATRSLITQYKSSPAFATDYPAFYYIYNMVNSGNVNGAWYLPARNELRMLYAGYSGKVYELIVGWLTNYMPGYDSPECVTARTQFDAKLTAKNGTAIGTGATDKHYLSSSEISYIAYYSVNFKNGQYSPDPKSYDGNIRWIREF